MQLLVCFPAGYAADHYRRDTVLKMAGVIGMFASFMTALALYREDYTSLLVAFGIWGIFSAFQSPAMESLFADSVPQGQRSLPFTLKHMAQQAAYILGPLFSIALLEKFGNTWELPELRIVLMSGVLVMALSLNFLFYFDDEKAHENKEAKTKTTEKTHLLEDPLTLPDSSGDHPLTTFLCLNSSHVPYILFTADFIIANGAGMTINFFPLFFFQEYGLRPLQVSILFATQPLLIVIFSFIAQRCSIKCGRMPIICSTRMASLVALAAMTYAKPLWLQIVLFLLRGSFMRCSIGLRRSVLMDHVPKKHRARWNSLEGLTMFTWSGSAVLGGYLIDAYSYRYCFLITAGIYFVGLVVELSLLPLTRKTSSFKTTSSSLSS